MRVLTATSLVLLACLCLSDAGCSQSVPEPPSSAGNSDSADSHEATNAVPEEPDSADVESEGALEPNVDPSATVAAEPQPPKDTSESAEASESVESAGASESAEAVETSESAAATEGMSRKEMLKQAGNGVVLITAFDTLGEETSFGSGSIVGERLVLTNLHNLAEAVTARVQLKNENDEVSDEGLPVTGYRILDETNDLALLEVEGLPASSHAFPVSDPQATEQFDEVFAIGHPNGLRFTTTSGYVNAMLTTGDMPEQLQEMLSGTGTNWIQTDAVVAGGNSGGPLLNIKGELVGINTLLFDRFAFAVGTEHILALLAADAGTVTALPVPGADVIVSEPVARIKADFDRELLQLVQDSQAVGSQEEFEQLVRQNNPAPIALKQCLEIARKHLHEPEATDALQASASVLSVSSGPLAAGRHYVDELFALAADEPDVVPPTERLVRSLFGLEYSREMERYLRAVIAQETDPQIQGIAGVVLAAAMYGQDEGRFGKETRELAADVSERFGDVTFGGTTVQEYLEPLLKQGGVSVGSEAPDIVGQDADDEEFRLSDYRGKVVVLDFWADWCPHCRAMYGHERELVERLKDEPFALLGVNGDDPNRAQRVIAEGKVTWRSWIDGSDGPIAEQWQISSWPTVYVLDKEGLIRFEGVRGDDLAAAVESLLDDSGGLLSGDVIAAGSEWRYSTAEASANLDDWTSSEFDDSEWDTGSGPIGDPLEDVQTELPSVPAGSRPITTLFRRSFDAPASELSAKLLVRAKFGDGIVVRLNSEEVFRSHLAAGADLTDSAFARATQREAEGIAFFVDSSLLKPSGNCIAVELHRFSGYSANAIFDLSMTAGLPQSGEELTMASKRELCRTLAQAGEGYPDAESLLEHLQGDSSVALKIEATLAAAMHEFPYAETGYDSAEDQRRLAIRLVALGQDAQDIASRPGLSIDQYERAVRGARAAHALRPLLESELRSHVPDASRAIGVALYRSGRYQDAVQHLDESLETAGQNPVGLAFLCMAHRELAHADESNAARERFDKLMQEPEWRHDKDATAAQQELNQ